MPEALWFLLALLSCVTGFAWLALSMETHWRQLRAGQPLPAAAVVRLRWLGSVALAVSLLCCLVADHPSMAVLVFAMTLAAAALIVAFTFTWQPRVFAPLVAWIGHSRP